MEPDAIVGSEVAGYSVESVLGRGAMGVVYVARQRSPARLVALKLIAPAFANDEAFRRRFLREAAAAAAIEHPHILPVYATGESDGTLFMATRLIEGLDLRELLARLGTLPLARVETVARQVGEALDAAHARGLVHRDVKPGNVLVVEPADADDEDFCYLTDFGVSVWTASTAETVASTGHLVGTANYVAPEQIEGGRVDGRADQYSLGCVLYECLTGRPPFGGRNPPATLYAHVHEPAIPPSDLRPGLPGRADAVLARALRKDPADRYGSCREFAKDLRDGLSASPPVQPASTVDMVEAWEPASRRRRPWLSVTVGVLGAALVAITASVAFRDGAPPITPKPRPELIRDGVQVIASSTAPSSTDAAGHPVTYMPANVIDGEVGTAWRTPGDGHGETLTLIFDNPIDLVRIGLIPGYAKTDPESGVNRFTQNRVIRSVTYEIPGVADTRKTFRAAPAPQFVRLHATTSRVTVRIRETSEPGSADFTAISEIYVYGFLQ